MNAMSKVEARGQAKASTVALPPAWLAFIRYCQQLGFGEISTLKIQDGVPVLVEETTRKVKFS